MSNFPKVRITVNQLNFPASAVSSIPFCALEYRATDRDESPSRDSTIILLVFKDVDDNLSFLVEPDWRSMVQQRDIDYLDSLFQDFIERASLEPNALFAQLSALAIGPLVARTVGLQIADYPSLVKLCSRFAKI